MAGKKKLGQILIKLVRPRRAGPRRAAAAAALALRARRPLTARPPPLRPRAAPQVSTAQTGYFYVTKKNPRNVPYKLQRVKFDPLVNRRVLFTEGKMK
ncbi:rpmG [Scenedesmus sp. PABB004]|nr:rpmG [Scenedesmus sp. PABB004]